MELGGGIGYELGDVGNDLYIGGVDLDSCLDGEVLADWAAAIMVTAPDIWREIAIWNGSKALFLRRGRRRPAISRSDRRVPNQVGVPTRTHRGKTAAIMGPPSRSISPTAISPLRSNGGLICLSIALLEWEALQRISVLIPPPPNWRPDHQRAVLATIPDLPRHSGKVQRCVGQGKTFEEMVAALRSDPETTAWVREKGDANRGRELRRIWDKAALPFNGASEEERLRLDDFYAYMRCIATSSRRPVRRGRRRASIHASGQLSFLM